MSEIEWEPDNSDKAVASGIDWDDSSPSSAKGMATSYLSGINKGLFHLTGGSMFEYMIDKPGKNSIALYGMQRGVDALKEFTGVTHQPTNSSERIAQRAGEDLALGAATAAMTLASAGVALPATMEAKLGERVVSSIFEAVKKSPMATSIYEMLGTSAAGGAMESAKEAGGGIAAQTGAGLVGALTPAAPGIIWKALSHTTPALFVKMFNKSSAKAIEEVAKSLKTGIGDMADLVRSNKVFESINAKKLPSVAEASGDPGLIARQRQIEAESSGSELDFYIKRHRDVVAGIEEGAKTVAPESTFKDQEIVVDAARVRLEAQRRSTQLDISDVESDLAITGRSLPEATDRIAAGRTLKEIRNTIRSDVSDSFKKEAEDIGLNNPGTEFNATLLRDEIRGEFFDPKSKYARDSKSRILKRVNKTKEEVDSKGKSTGEVRMTWEDVKAIREELNDEISVHLASGERNKARELIRAKDMVDNFVETNSPNGIEAEAWASFRGRYKQEFIERFEKGTSYKISGANQRGEYFTNEEMVADAFLQNESTVADFFNLYGNQADAAVPLLRTAILDRARRASVVDGVVNEKALGKFIESGPISRVLKSFPNIHKELADIRSATSALSLRAGVLSARAKDIEASSLKRVLDLSGDPDQMLSAALKNPKMMQDLVDASVAAGYGRRPVASLVWQRAELSFSENGVPTPDSVLRFLKNNRQSVAVALGERHTKALTNVYEALEIAARVGSPKGSVPGYGFSDKLRETTGVSIPQVASRAYAYSAGLIGRRHMMFESAVRFFGVFTGRRAKSLMKEALYDENIAKDIDIYLTTPSMGSQARLDRLSKSKSRLNTALFNMGLSEITDE